MRADNQSKAATVYALIQRSIDISHQLSEQTDYYLNFRLSSQILPCSPMLQVTQSQSGSAVAEPPADGIFVDGLWIDGGRWDSTAGCLQESQPGVMRAPLPVVHFKPVQSYEPPAEQYQCPLYKTSERAGVLSTTGQSTNFVLCVSLPVARGTGTDFWVLQGVALLCQLDT